MADAPRCGRYRTVDVAPGTSVGAEGDRTGSSADLRRLVDAHIPADLREAEAKERFLAELDRLERPLDETAGPVHVTASAVVAGRRGTLLHRHRKLGRWMQPGGHLDPGESPPDAALREAQEETGLALVHPPGGPAFIHLDVHQAAVGHTHLDLRYVVIGSDEDPRPPPGESPEARWYGWGEAAAIADESLVGALRTAREAWERLVQELGSGGSR
jgi:8-oxo-dGTP pyrophosphatase MutT (NUDIX family)